jgi:hypothetical protein
MFVCLGERHCTVQACDVITFRIIKFSFHLRHKVSKPSFPILGLYFPWRLILVVRKVCIKMTSYPLFTTSPALRFIPIFGDLRPPRITTLLEHLEHSALEERGKRNSLWNEGGVELSRLLFCVCTFSTPLFTRDFNLRRAWAFRLAFPPLNSFLAKDSSAMLLEAKYREYRERHLGFGAKFSLLIKCQHEGWTFYVSALTFHPFGRRLIEFVISCRGWIVRRLL